MRLGLGLGLSPSFGGRVADPFTANGFKPPYVADFVLDRFRVNGSTSTRPNAMTISRAGLGTMVDSDGVLKWGPHNLAPRSDNLANWSKLTAGDSVEPNVAVAPGGSMTADRYIADATIANHIIRIGWNAVLGVPYRLGAVVKRSGYDWVRVSDNFALAGFVYVNLATGTLGSSANATDISLTHMGDGWYLVEFTTQAAVASGPQLQIQPTTSDGVSLFEGDNTSGFYFWVAYVNRLDLGGMAEVPLDERVHPDLPYYVPTTTAAVYLPRRGHHVYEGGQWVPAGVLTEQAATNLLLHSQDFTNAAWVTSATGTLELDAVGPDGQANSALTLRDNGAGGTSVAVRVRQDVTVAASTAHTFSVFAKSDQLTYMWLGAAFFTTPSDFTGAFFGLSTGGIGTVSAGHTATIQDFGDGWYRCSITFTTDASDTTGQLIINVAGSASNTSADLDGTSSILIYGAQLEVGSVPSSYIPTSGAQVARVADTVQVEAARLPAPKVIGEELITNGGFDSADGWSTNRTDTTIADGTAHIPGNSELRQNGVFEAGKFYRITFEIVGGTGPVEFRVSSNISLVGSSLSFSSLGAYTVYAVANGADFRLFGPWNSDRLVDNVSVREVDPSISIAWRGRVSYADTDNPNQAVFYAIHRDGYVQSRINSLTPAGDGVIQFLQHKTGFNTSGPDHYAAISPGINLPVSTATVFSPTAVAAAFDGTLTGEPNVAAENSFPNWVGGILTLTPAVPTILERLVVWNDDIDEAGIEEASA